MSFSVAPVSRANNFSTMGIFTPRNNVRWNNCTNTLCYTYNHSYVYTPGTGYGAVGTTAAGYRGRRKRL